MVAVNVKTNARRTLPDLTAEEHEEIVYTMEDICTGPCECRVEVDNWCQHGWPSRLMAADLI